jgi:hypothetical protein
MNPERRHREERLASAGMMSLAGLVLLGLTMGLASIALAQSTIYRCHGLDGQLIFQDKPCDQLANTREARRGSTGEIIPNAPPPPAAEGPPLVERYERYLDAQSARRAAEAAATPPAPVIEYVGVGRAASVSPGDGLSYPGYGEGYYPYPIYLPYRDPIRRGSRPSPPYRNPGPEALPKPTPLPTIMQEPGLAPPPPRPRASTPGQVVARRPGH